MNKRFIHFLVLFVALLMPFQAFSMAMAVNKTSCADTNTNHCKHMQKSAMGEHCKMQVSMQHASQPSKQTHPSNNAPAKADCCQGNACGAVCAGLMLPTSMSSLALNAANDFSFFAAPHFYSQSPDSLERPPRC